MASNLTYSILNEIAQERDRQINKEGFTTEGDDKRIDRSLALAGAAYADAASWPREKRMARLLLINRLPPSWWPWSKAWWKPTTRRRDLIKATSLLVAEIERLDRIVMIGGDPDAESEATEAQSDLQAAPAQDEKEPEQPA